VTRTVGCLNAAFPEEQGADHARVVSFCTDWLWLRIRARFRGKGGYLTFAPGQTVTIRVYGDTESELNETYPVYGSYERSSSVSDIGIGSIQYDILSFRIVEIGALLRASVTSTEVSNGHVAMRDER